jgi:hypothetical protein
VVQALGEAGFEPDYVRPVSFEADLAVWVKFNRTHDFDLYGGQEPFQWCDWMELRFIRPASPDPA